MWDNQEVLEFWTWLKIRIVRHPLWTWTVKSWLLVKPNLLPAYHRALTQTSTIQSGLQKTVIFIRSSLRDKLCQLIMEVLIVRWCQAIPIMIKSTKIATTIACLRMRAAPFSIIVSSTCRTPVWLPRRRCRRDLLRSKSKLDKNLLRSLLLRREWL